MHLAARLALATAALAVTTDATAEIQGKVVEYRQGDTVLEGYVAWDPAGPARRPGVLVVHDWTGVGPYVKSRARPAGPPRLRGLRRRHLRQGSPPGQPEGGQRGGRPLQGEPGPAAPAGAAGLAALRQQPFVDTGKVAAIGYCFGGTTVLELARGGADLAGVVTFHGGLDSPTPADGKNIKAKVLVLHGADDPFVPADQVKAFEDELRAGGVDWQLVMYSGAVHSFTRPDSGNDNSKGAAYNATADRRSWAAMRAFFDEVLR